MRPRRLLCDALLEHAAAPGPSRTACVVEGAPFTYAQLRDQAGRLARALQRRGVGRGDRVAIYMDNTWPCVVSIYAAMLADAVFVLVNPQTKADKLAFILNDCGAKALLTDAHLIKEFAPAAAAAPNLSTTISSGVNLSSAVENFDDVIAAHETAETSRNIPLDLAALIYTSGSTGNPKGVMQTHQSMMFACASLCEYLRLSASDRILLMLPMAFDYGLYQLLMTVHLGATLVAERSFIFPAQIFARMTEQAVTVFPGVPTVYALLLSMDAREPLCFPEVKRVTNTAAHLPDQFVPRLHKIFPNALIFKMYGLTECKRVCYLEPELLGAKPGSVGKAIPGTEVFLLNDTGQRLRAAGSGVLHVRGPHVMAGYWNQPELTAHMLRPGNVPGEQILCTHDKFRMDEEGFLYFVGRSDDIIKTRGEKVSPIEVENVLHAMPGVREAAVVGVSDPVLGEFIRAFIVPETGSSLIEIQIRAFCAARLENFMVPKEFVLRDELPKTATGKVSKRLLRELQ